MEVELMSVQEMSTQQRARETLEDVLVVDCDVHVSDTPQVLAPYCDMPWRKSLEVLANVPQRYLDIPGYAVGTGTLTAPFPGGVTTRGLTSPKQAREELSSILVDIGILFPDNLLKIATLPQKDYAAALARAYNRWLVDQWVLKEKGLLGLIIAAPQDPEDAARELEKYAKEPGIVGVYLPCAGVEPLWGHRVYNPIYEAAQATGLPVLLHSVTVVFPVFPWQTQQFDTEFARHTLAHTFSMCANMVDIVTTGVPVRYPDLRMAFTEAGLGWVPFIMNRLDKEYIERRREVPFLTERPSHYLKKYFYATQPIEEPENLRDLVKIVELFEGEDQVIFASDWPHHDFDHPSKLFQAPFSPEAKRKIMGENALRLFNIDRDGNRLNL
jgi:predicted TIM-barrel fold metal-dependent hydrolase